ncbi:MAG TPA: enoyl-CoA hydratase/isomerase family protein [Pseudonocardiaceae bacterium]|nr:enoyl-CoA hydratase/isomerase family protein [Pseudonocardiaceae bacterium]
MTGDIVRTQRAGVVELRLNRPDSRNALSTALLRELRDQLDSVRADPAVRVLLLTGAGTVFCAGADITEFGPDADVTTVLTRTRLLVDVLNRLLEAEQPTIAAVHGAAVGGGWGLALACDLCLAAETATFSLPEVRKGYRLPAVLVARLAQVVGPVRAADLVFGGTTWSAEDARTGGAASRVVASAELIEQSWAMATTLAGTARRAIVAAKAPLRQATTIRPFPPAELFWTEE